MSFLLKCLKNNADLYLNRQNLSTDSGMDLFFSDDFVIPASSRNFKVGLGVSLERTDKQSGYYLYPRSSISKTPLMMCNSVGIIDWGYRGEIIAFVNNFSDKDFQVKRGMSLFQVCLPDLSPITFKISDSLSSTERGEGGFGSTNKTG